MERVDGVWLKPLMGEGEKKEVKGEVEEGGEVGSEEGEMRD